MRLSASFEVSSGLIPLRSDHVLSGVASTILDGEVSTVTSLSLSLSNSMQINTFLHNAEAESRTLLDSCLCVVLSNHCICGTQNLLHGYAYR